MRAPLPSKRRRLITAAVFSLLAHALILPLIAQSPLFQGGRPAPRRSMVSLVPTQRSQVQRLMPIPGSHPSAGSSPSLTPTLPPEPQVVELKPKEPERIDGQVVSLGQPKDERAPEKATKYLSEKNSHVDKETRARETSPFFKNALSKVQKEGENKQEAAKAQAPTPPALVVGKQGENGEKAGEKQVARQQAQRTEIPSQKRVDRLRLQQAEDGSVQNRASSEAIPGQGRKLAMARPQDESTLGQLGEGKGKEGLQGAPGLLGPQKPLTLSLNDMGQALGRVSGGPMNDELRGVEEGDETLLNSRSFRYAGFLNRIKEQVGRIWVINVQDEAQRRDPTGQAYTYKDRRTVVEFTLDNHGELRDVHVASSSGVDFLDRVAVDAFRKAERFPNPPVGLMDANGLVRLPFAFTLLAAQGGGLHLSFGPAYVPGSPAQRGF